MSNIKLRLYKLLRRMNISSYPIKPIFLNNGKRHQIRKFHNLESISFNGPHFLTVAQFNHTNLHVRRMATSTDIGIKELEKFQDDKDTLIIDVREKDEILETGILPGAVHIPLGNVAQALQKSPGEFEELYGCPKPANDAKIVFSCRSGKRSLAACDMAKKLGYSDLCNFAGGWLEWEKHMKK